MAGRSDLPGLVGTDDVALRVDAARLRSRRPRHVEGSDGALVEHEAAVI